MLALLVKSATRRKVVAFFALNSELWAYPRQVATEIEDSPHAVGLELRHLVRGGLLHSRKENGRQLYQWNAQYPYAAHLQRIVHQLLGEHAPEVTCIPSVSHRARVQSNLKKVVADLKQYYHPEKIILFGSVACGTVGPYSDIDLAIIKETALPQTKRVQQVIDLLDYDTDIDFVIYTPGEFEAASREHGFIRDEIVKKGKVLYDATL